MSICLVAELIEDGQKPLQAIWVWNTNYLDLQFVIPMNDFSVRQPNENSIQKKNCFKKQESMNGHWSAWPSSKLIGVKSERANSYLNKS